VISVVLLYYSVAWTILRCNHDEHPTDSIVASQASHHHALVLGGESANIDCTDYIHTEILAGPAPSPQIHRKALRFSLQIDDFFAFERRLAGPASHPLTFATRGSTGAEPIDAPLYLFFASLRI